MKDLVLLNKMHYKILVMPFHQMDVDGSKSSLFLLSYSPLEPMVINFTCDYFLGMRSAALIPPDWYSVLDFV